VRAGVPMPGRTGNGGRDVYIPGGAPKQWTTDAVGRPTPSEPARDLAGAERPPDEVRRGRWVVWGALAVAAARIRLSAQGG
jgi:hypothetical protein